MDKVKKAVTYCQNAAKNELYTGKGVGVAILDTGACMHLDFGSRILAFRDYVRGRTMPYDDNGHGTHVAGIIGGNGRASRGRYCGIAPGCGLIPIKVLDEKGNGKKESVIYAMDWIEKNREKYNIRIVNISVGSTTQGENQDLIEAVEHIWDIGLVVVAAAGNLGPKRGSITAPGCSRKVITVGASDMVMENQGISGRGPTRECISKPDIVAPGNGIISCAYKAGVSSYAAKSGTSMSTPVVAGGIALLLEKEPGLTNLEIKKRLRDTAKDLGYAHNLQGWGFFHLPSFLSGEML